jgi:hypothetical protein
MSVAIATMGMFCNDLTGPVQGADDLGSDPIAYGGGPMPGAYPLPKKRMKISVKNVNTLNEQTLQIKVLTDA